MALVTFSLGATVAVFVAGSASAAGSKGTTSTKAKSTTTTKTTTKTTTETPTTLTTTPDSPAAHFFVINGTVNAASDHEIVGSSAFPNFTTGAVDNYYSMTHSHVDNSPFAEGRASPADTGPIGQTAAAGSFQQPQYADARWPGDPPKATYGSQGGPYATAAADEYRATADASEASNGLSGPGLPNGAPTLAVPKGFDGQLRQALAGWKAKWQGLAPKKKVTPTVTTPVATVTLPKAPLPKAPLPKAPAPKVKVTTPSATVTTPLATVTTPNDSAGGASPAPPVTVPSTSLPTVGASGAPRSMASASTPGDGETLLTSSTMATLDSKTNTLVTSGESSLGRVSLGGGQIVIEGIHVTASIANDGTPSYKAAVSVASATIGGVPVTIDQDGVHVAGQGAGLPYQQASDALNGALKQAGIQLFLVGPEVTKPCGQTGTGTGTSTTTTTTTTTTTSSDQSGTTSSPSSCDQTGSTAGCDSSGGGTGPSLPNVGPGSTTTTTSTNQTDTTTTQSSCDQTSTTATCSQNGTTTNGTTTTTGGVPNIGPSTTTNKTTTTATTTTKTSTDQTDTTTTPSGCDQTGTLPPTSSCSKTGSATGTTTTSTGQTSTTAAPSPFDPMGGGADSGASEETVTATGVHLVFTQPVNQSGVPSQFVEHILGEVFVDSLAVPAGNPPNLDLSSSPASSSALSASSSCGGGHSSKTASSGASTAGGGSSTAGGGSSVGGSTASGASSPSGSGFGSASQPTSSSTGNNSLPAAFAAALRKPLWLLLAYVLWQAIVMGTGASLWNWRRGETS
jgi:hypothetical protein